MIKIGTAPASRKENIDRTVKIMKIKKKIEEIVSFFRFRENFVFFLVDFLRRRLAIF